MNNQWLYLRNLQTSLMTFEIVNEQKLLTIFANKLHHRYLAGF